MTEQEAEAWAARLTRIWVCEWFVLAEVLPTIFAYDAALCLDPQLQESVYLEVVFGQNPQHSNYRLRRPPLFLAWEYERECYWGINDRPDEEDLWGSPEQAFVGQFLPFFRRGCWLSGCPIEASAHEKAEWIQGFSQEELQAWNLKI